MATRSRFLVALLFDAGLEAEINGLRRALGSTQLARIPPHVTLVPPTNVDSSVVALALRVVVDAATMLQPFALDIGPPSTFADNAAVLFLSVAGDDEVLHTLRASLLTGPFRGRLESARPYVGHVTLLSSRAPEDSSLISQRLSSYRIGAIIRDLALLEQDDEQPSRPWAVVARVDLGTGTTLERAGTRLHLSSGSAAGRWLRRVAAEWDLDPAVTEVRDGSFVAAFDGEDPVGIVSFETSGVHAEMRLFAVAPSMRSLGVGSSLMSYLHAQLRRRGVEFVTARSTRGSDLTRFLEDRGWTEPFSTRASAARGEVLLARRILP